MISVLSPAKTLERVEVPASAKIPEQYPALIDETAKLLKAAKKLTKAQIAELMGVSAQIAQLNYERFQNLKLPLTKENSHPAIFTFQGDVYTAIEPESYSAAELKFLNNHVRILSGFYGVLRPLERMAEYRMEMGLSFPVQKAKNLYEFWAGKITEQINNDLKPGEALLNLASQEYFKPVRPELLKGPVFEAVFQEKRNGSYKVVAFNAKRARGAMTDWIVRNRVDSPDDLKKFDDGYTFDHESETKNAVRLFFYKK